MKKIYFLIVIGFGFGTLLAQDNCATALPITSAGTFTISTINGTELPFHLIYLKIFVKIPDYEFIVVLVLP
jgi:hypothetical protein